MIFIYKITELKFCIPLREYLDMTLAENEASAYTPCSRLHRKLILTTMVLKFFTNYSLNDGHSENRKINIFFKITVRALFAWRGSYN